MLRDRFRSGLELSDIDAYRLSQLARLGWDRKFNGETAAPDVIRYHRQTYLMLLDPQAKPVGECLVRLMGEDPGEPDLPESIKCDDVFWSDLGIDTDAKRSAILEAADSFLRNARS